MKRIILLVIITLGLLYPYAIKAQIGYQVTLLNNATGEPRANESVTVDLRITDKNGKTIYSESQNSISNDFGVISLTVGHEDMFKDADWSNLPFFISASVNGIQIGSSQIPSVPVAEYAKKTGSNLTMESLCTPNGWVGTFSYGNDNLVFYSDGTYLETYYDDYDEKWINIKGNFYIVNNLILTISEDDSNIYFYIPQLDVFKTDNTSILFHRL